MNWILRLTAGLLAALPQVALADSIGGGGGVSISPWRVIAALALCLALGTAAILVLRKHYGIGRTLPLGGPLERRIRIVEQQSLGPQRSLSLIEIDGQSYAALLAPGAATLVPLADPQDVAPATRDGGEPV